MIEKGKGGTIMEEEKQAKTEGAKENKKFEQAKVNTETKKTTTTGKPKAEKEKNKSVVVRAIAVMIVLLIVVGLIYMALPSPARALQQMLRDLKAGNFEKAEEYVDYHELMNIPGISTANEEQTKILFEDLTFTVKEVKQEGDRATIEVETTNKDFKTIVQNAVTKLLQKYFGSEEAEIGDELLEELQTTEAGKTTLTQTVTVEKQEGKWKVIVDDNLKNAVFPGLEQTLETVTSANMFSED